MRHRNACLRLFVVLLQDLHCLQRFYHNVDHWGIKLYYHTKFHISRAFISQIVAPIIIHGLRLLLVILQEVHRFKHDNALYPQWNYITVPSFMF